MQVLHSKYPDLGILAFPCNDFGGQEPYDNAKIKDFAENKMGFNGLVLGKLKCDNRSDTAPIYKSLMNSIDNDIYGQGLKWNFAKFLCDSSGKPISRYSPQTNPLSFEEDIVSLMNSGSAASNASGKD